MKRIDLRALTLAISVMFISCSNDKKQTEIIKQVSKIKSDILIENKAVQENGAGSLEEHTLTLSGKTLLDAMATLKVTDSQGEEVSCISYPARQLVHQEYRTANSALKEVHIRQVVENYFEFENELTSLTDTNE